MARETGRMKQLDRSGLAGLAGLAVLLVAIGMLVLAGAFLWLHVTTPSDGARLEPGEQVWRPQGVLVTPLEDRPGGLRRGDLVVAVDGRSMESWAQALFDPGTSRPSWQFGESITYTVLRDGQWLGVAVTLGRYPFGAILRKNWGTILFALVSQFIATFVFLRRRDDQAARVLFLWASGVLSSTTWSLGLQVSDLVNAIGFWLFIGTTFGAYMIFWIAGLHFALVFPRPLPVILHRPWIARFLYVAPYALYPVYLAAVWPGASSTLDWLGRWSLGNSLLVLVYLALAVVVVTWGYRTNIDSISRQKIRWVMFAALVSGGGGLVLWILPPLVVGRPIISPNALGLLVLPFPLALAVAILRHHLFDIDLVINHTLVYGALTASTMGLYVFMVGYLGSRFQAGDKSLIAFITTGLVAVLFQPLRARLQRGVNRLMYGERDDPVAVLSRLGERLEGTVLPEAVLPGLVETVAQALKLPYVAIALDRNERRKTKDEGSSSVLRPSSSREEPDIVASYGLPMGECVHLPLVYQAETVGYLVVGLRAPGESFGPADQVLLENIARQAGAAVRAVQLTTDLQRSRQRLVTAREEERRRLRRDLHDGLGPVLASQGLKLAAIRQLVGRDLAAAEQLLDEVMAQTEATVAEVRRLVYALRPPALDELGLVEAIRDHVVEADGDSPLSTGLQITVEEPREGLPPLGAAVEVAAYRIALEGLTNVVRHAGAQSCVISFSLDKSVPNGILQLEIRDDGVGLPEGGRAGVGLNSMRERAEEVGGTFAVGASPGGGTRLIARLPLTD
jgi:two-component system NarL family sensor kinase